MAWRAGCNRPHAPPHSRFPCCRGHLMEMTGERRIPAPRQRVWERLNDPETLKQCIPGCETIEKVSDTEFTAKVTAKVGPVKASFSGKVTLTDLDPPAGYTITGEGTGGGPRVAQGSGPGPPQEGGGGREGRLRAPGP